MIDWMGILKFIARPLITVAVWLAVDRLLKKLHSRSRFIDKFLVRHESEALKKYSLEQRLKTFRGLFIQIVRILNAIFFIFILLDNLRIDIKPLLAGVGVVGLGLSLATQNILRDFLNGLFILIEDQFNIGDFVEIGPYSGTVDGFTMRATRLRTYDGKMIIIPNGTVSQVVNYTKSYSVSIVDIGVSYDTDIPKAMEILRKAAERLGKEKSDLVTEESSVLGIMDFRESDILLRVSTRTLPGEHWGVGRALRILIKEEFEKAGIKVPFPQRVVHIETNDGKKTC